MKICIWFKVTDGPWGGGNQFLRALSKYLVRNGHEVIEHPDSTAHVVLLNSHNRGPNLLLNFNQIAQLRSMGKITWWGKLVPKLLWLTFHRKGQPILHRLDGVAELIRGYHTKADDLQISVNSLCDYTIFQSVYSQVSFANYGINPSNVKVVYNGVDGEIFFPPETKKGIGQTIHLIAVSWSPNLRKGFTSLAAISCLPKVELKFIGQWPKEVNPQNTILLGKKTSSEIAEILRQSDVFIHAAENEPCSNAILEALACGLPIIYRDSGGNSELAKEYGIPLSNELENNLSELMVHYYDFRKKLLEERSKFLIEHIARVYLGAFEDAIQIVETHGK
jgi:glycosyltransferase involved in cell wall biosynthesis